MPRATHPGAITVAVMLATFLAALDTTVVGTAMPTIIGDLGALDLYSWVFSAYLLTSTTAVPLFGRLADTFGRKPVFLAGTGTFLLGSTLCGLAGNMEQLIAFRGLQGLGAAAVIPISMTVVGDIFSVAERAKVQGLLGTVWGISAILGPGIGGLIADNAEWRWVFYVNLPFGLVSMLLFALYLHETPCNRSRSVDYVGTVALTAGISVFLLGLLETGQTTARMPIPPWLLLVAGANLLVLFVWQQSRADDPILPVALFSKRLFCVSNAAGFVAGAALMGVDSFVPPFVQGVLGGSAISAGAALAPMSIGWPIASALSGRVMVRHGYRPAVLLGSALILVGALLLLPPVDRGIAQPLLMFAMLVMGFGMGFAMTSFLVAVQSSVGWGERGAATAMVSFFRSIGGAVGVSAMGGLLNSGVHRGMEGLDAGVLGTIDSNAGIAAASVVLDPVARTLIPPVALDALRSVFASSLYSVYLAIAGASLLGLGLALLFPRTGDSPERRETK